MSTWMRRPNHRLSVQPCRFRPRVEALEERCTPATLPTGFTETRLAAGLASPTAMTIAPDGRVFVCEQGGAVRIIKNGELLGEPFLRISVHHEGEAGLLGIALDPQFASNGFVYLYYTTASPLRNQISRFRAAGDVADNGSKRDLFELNTLGNAHNHNGGALHFGPDGKLYVAVGDNATPTNAQRFDNLLGKILRINPDGTIPSDNPFYASLSGNNRAIWALGLRNPFTFAFQPGANRMFINDVGQNKWEEINEGVAGVNYGWPLTEGPTDDPRFRAPLYAYDHTVGNAITGSAFYSPAVQQFPAGYAGDYFFADYGGGWIKRYDLANKNVQTYLTGAAAVIDIDVDAQGYLYYLDRGYGAATGRVFQVAYVTSEAPFIKKQPADAVVAEGKSATFAVTAAGGGTLHYQWQRNGVPIPGATNPTYTLSHAQLTDSGARYRVVVTNDHGTIASRQALVTVTANKPPRAKIVTPVAGTKFTAGNVIAFTGTGTDPEDGALPASAFTWRVDYHTGGVPPRPLMPEAAGITSGSFTIPTTTPYTQADVFYRIVLTVVDANGATHVATRDVLPRTAKITLATAPSSLKLTLDGQPVDSGTTFIGVAGVTRTLGVTTVQTHKGVTWEFDHWSDGGAANHEISTPGTATTFVANFRLAAGSIGSGNGLLATYYDNEDYTGKTFTRVDPTINFNWGLGQPLAGIAKDAFSVRWAGFLQAQLNEDYVFSARANDGVRLWVDKRKLLDAWGEGTQKVESKPISLNAGQKYLIVVDYRELRDDARMQMWWQSPSTPRSFIPSTQLYAPEGMLANGWQLGTIGKPKGGNGSAALGANTLVLNGGGAPRVDGKDNYQFVYAQLTGDGEITARVLAIQKSDATTHAGITFRDSFDAGSPFVAISVNVNLGVSFAWRDRPGQAIKSSNADASVTPIWLRLRRTGNTFEAFQSVDGVHWVATGSNLVDMNATVQVGLFVSSASAKHLTTAVFDGVSLRPFSP